MKNGNSQCVDLGGILRRLAKICKNLSDSSSELQVTLSEIGTLSSLENRHIEALQKIDWVTQVQIDLSTALDNASDFGRGTRIDKASIKNGVKLGIVRSQLSDEVGELKQDAANSENLDWLDSIDLFSQ